MSIVKPSILTSPLLSAVSPESLGASISGMVSGAYGSKAWTGLANRAYYIPFSLREIISVTSLWVANGTTASGNIDIGIYTADGTRIISTGSTAQSGTSTVQKISTTATTLGVGSYYLALVMSSATATTTGLTLFASAVQPLGILVQTSALPLPASATFATAAGSGLQEIIPLFGLAIVPLV